RPDPCRGPRTPGKRLLFGHAVELSRQDRLSVETAPLAPPRGNLVIRTVHPRPPPAAGRVGAGPAPSRTGEYLDQEDAGHDPGGEERGDDAGRQLEAGHRRG